MNTRHTGFTMIELMTAVGIVAILTAIAVPGFQQYTRNSRTTATHNALVTSLSFSRSEALRRSTPVTVCASIDGATCTAVAADWPQGWIAFTDGTGTPGLVDAPNDEVLQVWPALAPQATLVATSPFVRYDATGMVIPSAIKTFDVSFAGCAAGPYRRVLAVSAIGSLESTKANCP